MRNINKIGRKINRGIVDCAYKYKNRKSKYNKLMKQNQIEKAKQYEYNPFKIIENNIQKGINYIEDSMDELTKIDTWIGKPASMWIKSKQNKK